MLVWKSIKLTAIKLSDLGKLQMKLSKFYLICGQIFTCYLHKKKGAINSCKLYCKCNSANVKSLFLLYYNLNFFFFFFSVNTTTTTRGLGKWSTDI